MASGANRGAYYAGFLEPLQEAGIDFELLAGVSAGGIAAAWIAAGDNEAFLESWRRADPWRVAFHPLLSMGRRRTVDQLIRLITLQTMDLQAARTAAAEVLVAVSRIKARGFPLPQLERRVLSNRQARDDEHLGLMLRATALMPWINGFGAALEIDGKRYMDGGLVGRVPLNLIPEQRVDEIWVAACSPSGRLELREELARWRRPERLVVLTPSTTMPVNRWTMEWSKISRAIAIGRQDMAAAIKQAGHTTGRVLAGGAASIEH